VVMLTIVVKTKLYWMDRSIQYHHLWSIQYIMHPLCLYHFLATWATTTGKLILASSSTQPPLHNKTHSKLNSLPEVLQITVDQKFEILLSRLKTYKR